MKKLSLLIALCMLLTVGGVYATWIYTQSTDVADVNGHLLLNLTSAEFAGTNGTFEVDRSGLSMKIDPKVGTLHTTSLQITGQLVIKFIPGTYVGDDIRDYGVPATFAFSLSNDNWLFDEDPEDDGEVPAKKIIVLPHAGEQHSIVWEKQDDGTFTMTLDATALAEHITLSELNLDSKADYDRFERTLRDGQIIITISDGITAPPATPAH